jgi:aminocarboxymuconate-semialdehyde decarboxylase
VAIDIQQHFVPPSLARAYADAGTGHADRREVTELELRLAEMTGASVDYALLSVPVWDRYDRRRDEAVAAVEAWNDETIEAANAHAGRFGVLATLPLPHADAAIAELERVRRESAVRGVVLHATTSRWTLDAPELEPVLVAIAEAGLPAMVHPSEEHLARDPVFADWRIGFWLAPVIETSLAVGRLMLSGVLDRASSLVLIVPHLGGVLPYLAQRAADLSGSGDADADVLHYLRTRCLFDNCSYHAPALACAIETVGAERIMVGSDYPFRGAMRRAVDDIEASGLSEAQQASILHGTATACGLGPPAGAPHTLTHVRSVE